ncbi:DNA-processing protein DprA [Planomonospora algeriensis]
MGEKLRERAALVALLRLPGIRWSEITFEVLEADSALTVLDRHLSGRDTLFPDTGRFESVLAEALKQLAAWEAEGITVCAFFDDRYPVRLRGIHQMPPLLFSKGSLVRDQRAIAVVGTRQASERGLQVAASIATELARNDVTVVSGLARGIDSAAHRAALAAGGRTVAVVGTGISRFYPPENRPLQEQITREGLVISQFWPDASPTKQSFPMRNAVMSGYAAATVVVEAPWKSGARIQARLALEHGRPVVIPTELLMHDWAREMAQKPGVHVVSGLQELLLIVETLIHTLDTGPEALPEIPQFAWSR